jgi:hypothetical protein
LGSHYPYNGNAYQPVQNFNPYANYGSYPQAFPQHNPHFAQYSGYPNHYQTNQQSFNQFSGTPNLTNTYSNNSVGMNTGFGF